MRCDLTRLSAERRPAPYALLPRQALGAGLPFPLRYGSKALLKTRSGLTRRARAGAEGIAHIGQHEITEEDKSYNRPTDHDVCEEIGHLGGLRPCRDESIPAPFPSLAAFHASETAAGRCRTTDQRLKLRPSLALVAPIAERTECFPAAAHQGSTKSNSLALSSRVWPAASSLRIGEALRALWGLTGVVGVTGSGELPRRSDGALNSSDGAAVV